MIAPSVVYKVRRLLAEGKLSQRKIARLLGINRGTVNRLAAKRRRDYAAGQSYADDSLEPAGLPSRCPGCGGLVYPPCMLCQARAIARSSRKRTPLPQTEEDFLDLRLKEEHRRRYEEVRARRELGSAAQEKR